MFVVLLSYISTDITWSLLSFSCRNYHSSVSIFQLPLYYVEQIKVSLLAITLKEDGCRLINIGCETTIDAYASYFNDVESKPVL